MKYFIPCACPISSSRQAVVNKTSNEEGRKIVRPLAVVVTKNGPTTIFGGTHHHAVALSLCVYCLLCCKHIITVFNFTKFLLFDVNLLTIRHGTNFESTAPTSLAMGEYPCVHTQKFRNAYAVCHSVPSAVFLVIGPSRPPTPSCILQIDVFGKSSQYYIIISMMTSFMHMSQKLVLHQSKCICAIKRILSTTAMYVSLSAFMYLRIPCYWDACLNSSSLRVGVKTLLNTIQSNLRDGDFKICAFSRKKCRHHFCCNFFKFLSFFSTDFVVSNLQIQQTKNIWIIEILLYHSFAISKSQVSIPVTFWDRDSQEWVSRPSLV